MSNYSDYFKSWEKVFNELFPEGINNFNEVAENLSEKANELTKKIDEKINSKLKTADNEGNFEFAINVPGVGTDDLTASVDINSVDFPVFKFVIKDTAEGDLKGGTILFYPGKTPVNIPGNTTLVLGAGKCVKCMNLKKSEISVKNGILKISVPKIKEEEKFIDLKIK